MAEAGWVHIICTIEITAILNLSSIDASKYFSVHSPSNPDPHKSNIVGIASINDTYHNDITLLGRPSFFPGATITGYSWTQTAGPAVSLNAANTVTPTFIAPTVTTKTVLIFSLTVTDSNGQVSSPSTTQVTVNVP